MLKFWGEETQAGGRNPRKQYGTLWSGLLASRLNFVYGAGLHICRVDSLIGRVGKPSARWSLSSLVPEQYNTSKKKTDKFKTESRDPQVSLQI